MIEVNDSSSSEPSSPTSPPELSFLVPHHVHSPLLREDSCASIRQSRIATINMTPETSSSSSVFSPTCWNEPPLVLVSFSENANKKSTSPANMKRVNFDHRPPNKFHSERKCSHVTSTSNTNIRNARLESQNIPVTSTNVESPTSVGRLLHSVWNSNEAKYRGLQKSVYNFLERPKTWRSITYHVIAFICVFCCLLLSVLSTIEEHKQMAEEILISAELCVLVWLFTEYCLRLWSAGYRSRYQTWQGRFKFARRPLCIIDVLVIVSSALVLVMGHDREVFAASTLRGLRFFQILRMFRMDRRGGSWKMLASVFWAHRQELFTTAYIGFLGLIFTSFLIYLVERDAPSTQIKSLADALWWGVVTLSTVGYGDMRLQTWLGKVIAACCCLALISFYALPPGILGSGFALKVHQHQRQKHLIRRRVPAANLIQRTWRCYVAECGAQFPATWKPHLRALTHTAVREGKCQKHNQTHHHRKPVMTLLNDEGLSEVGQPRFSTLTALIKSHIDGSIGTSDSIQRRRNSVLGITRHRESKKTSAASKRYLTRVEIDAIRAMRKMHFLVAKKKFKEALRPYDVKDVIEQYAAGHMDMLCRIKYLKTRLDQIVDDQSCPTESCRRFPFRLHETTMTIPLASRILNIEKSFIHVNEKLHLLTALMLKSRQERLASHDPPVAATEDVNRIERLLAELSWNEERFSDSETALPTVPLCLEGTSEACSRNGSPHVHTSHMKYLTPSTSPRSCCHSPFRKDIQRSSSWNAATATKRRPTIIA